MQKKRSKKKKKKYIYGDFPIFDHCLTGCLQELPGVGGIFGKKFSSLETSIGKPEIELK